MGRISQLSLRGRIVAIAIAIVFAGVVGIALLAGGNTTPAMGDSCAEASESERESWVHANQNFIPAGADSESVVAEVNSICSTAANVHEPQEFSTELLNSAAELATEEEVFGEEEYPEESYYYQEEYQPENVQPSPYPNGYP